MLRPGFYKVCCVVNLLGVCYMLFMVGRSVLMHPRSMNGMDKAIMVVFFLISCLYFANDIIGFRLAGTVQYNEFFSPSLRNAKRVFFVLLCAAQCLVAYSVYKMVESMIAIQSESSAYKLNIPPEWYYVAVALSLVFFSALCQQIMVFPLLRASVLQVSDIEKEIDNMGSDRPDEEA